MVLHAVVQPVLLQPELQPVQVQLLERLLKQSPDLRYAPDCLSWVQTRECGTATTGIVVLHAMVCLHAGLLVERAPPSTNTLACLRAGMVCCSCCVLRSWRLRRSLVALADGRPGTCPCCRCRWEQRHSMTADK